FPEGAIKPKELPSVWNAQALLTPFGGQTTAAISPIDQLAIANVTYDASDPANRFMRVGLYLFESLQYYDFFFKTSGARTQWWWLISDPAAPDDLPAKAFGPFATAAIVPPPDLLRVNNLGHVGSWALLGRPCDAFSGRRNARAGTWYWFDATGALSRIMNYDPSNDFQIAIFGAYYLVDFPTFRQVASSNLTDVHRPCSRAAISQAPSPMLTLCDILTAMASPPSGTQTPCTLQQIQTLIPGIAQPTGALPPPSWTNRVNSECFMIGVLTSPYYCQLWYDWDRGIQITVFVWPDESGAYTVRMDDWLPWKKPGHTVYYSWDGAKWVPACYVPPQPDSVAMPVPNFVERGGGI